MTNLKEKTAKNELERTMKNRNYAEIFKLGCDYFEQKNFDFAVQAFTKAIQLDTNNYEAYFERSRCYFCMGNYELVLTDCNKSIQLNPNFARAYRGIGLSYQKQKNDELALDWFRKSAELGDMSAQIELGQRYYFGKGAEKDYIQAVKWFEKAAEQGNKIAQGMLGNCYYFGNGVEKNYIQAVEWFEKSSEQGNAIAQERLGNCYYFGNGVEKDYIKAVQWFEKAAEQGNKMAQERLSDCYYFGNGVEKDYIQTVKWLEKAAEQGNASAQRKLGNCYYIGTGVEKDYIQTVKWLEKAAEQGNMSAQVSLGEFYYQGNGVKKDYIQAIKWIKKAAEQGSVFAQGKLGYYYYFGYGVEKNYSEAFAWFQKSAEKDNQSKINLAICYYHGCGIEQNYNLAVEWFQKVANQNDYAARAKTYLGICCYYGYGLEKNHEQAFNWFQKASEKNDSIGLLWLSYFHYLKNNQEDFFSFLFLAAANFQKDSQIYKYDSTIINGLFTIDIVDFLSTENKSPAKVILGFFYHYTGNEEKFLLLLEQASNQLDLIASYQLGKYYKEFGDFEKSVEYLNKVKQEELSPFNEIDSTNKEVTYRNDIKQWLTSLSKDEISDIERIKYQKQLEEKNQQLELEIQEKESAQKQVEEKNKELNNLIAMFAHNFLGTLQCIRSNAEHDNNAKIHLKTVKMMSGALTAFSIISADDDKLIEQLKQDNTGETNLLQNLANNLALAISQLLSKTNKAKIINLYLNYLCKTNQIEKDTNSEELKKNKDYREKWQVLQHQWEDEFNALFSENVELSSLQNWLADNFFPVQITGFDNYNIRFEKYGITDSIFLVIFMEILVNALKYMDVSQNKPLILTLEKQDQHYHLICENPSSQETYRGTHKGMDFLKSIARKLNAKFITESTEQQFKTTFIIPAELLD